VGRWWPVVESSHEEQRERDEMALEAEPETNKKKNPRKSLKLWEPFYLTVRLSSFKNFILERQF
jgi:hypothetical protein